MPACKHYFLHRTGQNDNLSSLLAFCMELIKQYSKIMPSHPKTMENKHQKTTKPLQHMTLEQF
jgi:hypothetical protein